MSVRSAITRSGVHTHFDYYQTCLNAGELPARFLQLCRCIVNCEETVVGPDQSVHFHTLFQSRHYLKRLRPKER